MIVSAEKVSNLLVNSEVREEVFWGKELVVSYRLPSGFSIIGRSACVDPNGFDIEVGRDYCLENAENKVWELEGYVAQLVRAGHIQDLREVN